MYQQEGIQFTKIAYIDNQPVLDLIEQKPQGVLPVLNEELIVPRGSDAGFLSKTSAHQAKCPHFKKSLKSQTQFVIKHYAGEVSYESVGFLEKNRDALSEDLLELVGGSRLGLMAQLFPPAAAGGKVADRKASLATQFQRQLDVLMQVRGATHSHRTLCAAPISCLAHLTLLSVFLSSLACFVHPLSFPPRRLCTAPSHTIFAASNPTMPRHPTSSWPRM